MVGEGCSCLKNPEGEIVALRSSCPAHGEYEAGRMPGDILDLDPDPLPGGADLAKALAELEARPPVMVDDDTQTFEPRPEGTTTYTFTLEVDSFGFMGDARGITKIAETVAQSLHRAMGPTFTPARVEGERALPPCEGMWRLWTRDGRRVLFDAAAADGEHAGHDDAVLLVSELH
jgi:hypothetical protein